MNDDLIIQRESGYINLLNKDIELKEDFEYWANHSCVRCYGKRSLSIIYDNGN